MASTLLEEHEDLASNLGVNALVDQIHSSAVDLIGGTGMDRVEALQALEEATAFTFRVAPSGCARTGSSKAGPDP